MSLGELGALAGGLEAELVDEVSGLLWRLGRPGLRLSAITGRVCDLFWKLAPQASVVVLIQSQH